MVSNQGRGRGIFWGSSLGNKVTCYSYRSYCGTLLGSVLIFLAEQNVKAGGGGVPAVAQQDCWHLGECWDVGSIPGLA